MTDYINALTIKVEQLLTAETLIVLLSHTLHRKEDTDTKVYCFTVQKQKQKNKILLKKHKK